MNQQLPLDSHSLIGAYKDKAQTEFFWLGQQEGPQGNGRAVAEQDSDVTLGRIGSRIGLPWLLK